MVTRKMASKYILVLMLGTCECINLYSKRHYADVIKWRVWDRRVSMGHLGGPNVRVSKGEWFRDALLLAMEMEEGATVQEM